MFQKEILMKNIMSRLSWLTNYVWQNNKLGWTDANHCAEDFYCGLLNTAFGWKLKNQNELKMDFPAIDLGDPENRICVQVTATTERSKVQRTLYKFFGNGLNEQYSRLIVLIIGEKPDYRSGFRVEEGFAFDPQADIWDLAVLNEKLNALEVDELEQVSQYLDKQLNLPAVNLPTLNLPLPGALEKGHFVGREAELAALAEKLRDPGSRQIFVTGLGGMGKTELVKRFCADYTGGRVYFALFQDTFTDTVALRMAQGLPGYQDRKPDPERDYQEVLELLRSCGPEDILVIDNADEPEGNFSKLTADPAWEELTKLPLRLIITTRCSVDRAVEAGAIAKESLRKIFDNHQVSLQDSDKDALIGAVGGHTMTVDLMARTLKVKKLLEAIGSGTLPEQKYRPVGVDRDGDSSQAQIYVHLKNLFRVAQLSENDKKLLRWAVHCQRESLPVAEKYAKDPNTLEFTMDYECLPDDVIHRLMVEMRNDLDLANVWRTGARFVQAGTALSAVVKSEGNLLRIFVRSENPMHLPNTYLHIIKGNIDRINADMRLQEPFCEVIYKDGNVRETFDYEDLIAALKDGDTTYRSKKLRRKIPIQDILNQSGRMAEMALNKLRDDIITACMQLQGNRMYWDTDEDNRNTAIRDALLNMGYLVNDQTFQGVGGGKEKRAGEPDLVIRQEAKIPWTICEALNISGKENSVWEPHLKKLLDNYNPSGMNYLFLLTYVESDRDTFPDIWNHFREHIRRFNPDKGNYEWLPNSFYEFSLDRHNNPEYIRAAKITYDRAGSRTTVCHIFARMGR